MNCPRCGQQQISEEIKFCSSCGFPLGLISEILAHGGFLPQLADLHTDKKWLTRKNGVVFSLLWLIFFLPLCTIIFGGVFENDILGGITAAIGIFGGLMIFIASLVFLKGSPKANSYSVQNEFTVANTHGLYGANPAALPPPQAQAAQSYIPPTGAWKAPNTGELTQPRSVVENTTKLLKKEE